MSLFSDVSLLSSSMRAFSYGLNTTANNIANVNTVGYSRQVVNFQALPPVWDGSIQLGSGVGVQNIQRVRDIFLDQQIKAQMAELGRATAHNEGLQQLGAIFPEIASPTSTAGIKGAVDAVTVAWNALAASPSSLALKANVRSSLQNLAQLLNTDSREVFALQQDLNTQVGDTITQANTLIQQIATLNKQIKQYPANNQPGSLLDQREQAAEKLTGLIGSQSRLANDGTLSVSFAGSTLVDGANGFWLRAISSSTDPGRTNVGYALTQTGGSPADITSQVSSGTLGGLLQTRDIDVEGARLTLDKVANGIITRSNQVNASYIASDFTTSHQVFTGSKASDISLSQGIVNNVDYLGGTRDALASGDLAKLQGSLENFIMYSQIQTAPFGSIATPGFTIDENAAMDTQPFLVLPNVGATPAAVPPGELVIVSGGNTVTVQWNKTQSLNQVIRNINTQGGGAFYATFDHTTQKVMIFSQSPLTVYDNTYNLGRALALSAVVVSSAPINNSSISQLNQADFSLGPTSVPLNSAQNTLDIYTQASSAGGTVVVDGTPVSWLPTDDIYNILLTIGAVSPVDHRISNNADEANQLIYLIKSGQTLFNNTLTLAIPLQSITVQDQSGNLSRVFNLDTDTNASHLFDAEITQLSGSTSAESVLKTQAQALVDQTQQLQDAQSKVDLNQELAQAALYQRSYEAAARLQFILDDIMNVLINHTGSSASSNSAV